MLRKFCLLLIGNIEQLIKHVLWWSACIGNNGMLFALYIWSVLTSWNKLLRKALYQDMRLVCVCRWFLIDFVVANRTIAVAEELQLSKKVIVELYSWQIVEKLCGTPFVIVLLETVVITRSIPLVECCLFNDYPALYLREK